MPPVRRTIDIHCMKCQSLLYRYSKGGTGGLVKCYLERIVEEHPLVLKDPAPVIKVHELADSSVNFVCRPWSKTSDYWDVFWDVTRAVKEQFDQEGVSIPFPQQDIHVRHISSPPAAAEATT